MILCFYQLNDSFFVHNLAGFHWGFSCNKSKICVHPYLIWNIGPFSFVKLSLSRSLFLCLKSYVELCFSRCPPYPSHLREEIPNLFFVRWPFSTNAWFVIAFYHALINDLICLSQFKGFLVLFHHKNLSKKKIL
jgi:hypothetical protein